MSTTPGSLVVASLLALAGCTGSAPRSVSGQIAIASYQATGRALDNPVVIARSTDHRAFIVHVAPNGTFQLAVPPNATYRLTLANSLPSGAFHALSRIAWPTRTGAARWAHVSTGGAIQLGAVHPLGVGAQASGPLSGAHDGSDDSGGGGGKCDDGEHDDEVDCDTGDEDESDCDDKGDCDGVDDDHGGGSSDGGLSGSSAGLAKADDGNDSSDDDGEDGEKSTCSAPDGGTINPNPNPNPGPNACQTNLDCSGGLVCFQNVCTNPIL
jgi:hypothetical protein